MPSRIVREGIITSLPVNSLTWPAEVFYRRLMSVADDYGRYYAHPALLRAACYPLQLDRVSDAQISKWLKEVSGAHLIHLYVNMGKDYLEIANFRQQTRSESKFPSNNCLSNDKQLQSFCALISDSDAQAHSESKTKDAAVAAPIKNFVESIEIPETLRTPEFEESWRKWIAHRRETRHPLRPTGATELMTKFDGWGPDRSVAAIRHSIANGYQGVFEPGQNGNGNGRPGSATAGVAVMKERIRSLNDQK